MLRAGPRGKATVTNPIMGSDGAVGLHVGREREWSYVIRTLFDRVRDRNRRADLRRLLDSRAGTLDCRAGHRAARHRNSFRSEGDASKGPASLEAAVSARVRLRFELSFEKLCIPPGFCAGPAVGWV